MYIYNLPTSIKLWVKFNFQVEVVQIVYLMKGPTMA